MKWTEGSVFQIMFTTHEKIYGHRDLTVSSQWPQWSRLRGPMITAQSRLGEVTAQSRRGHSSVTARSQLSHGEVTAQSRHLQYMITAQSQLGHSSITAQVTAGCDHFGHRELTVSSGWAHGEQSRWPIFFLMESHQMGLIFWPPEG